MKLKPIPQNIVVHTPTEAEAKELLAILHENGYKWRTGEELTVYLFWEFHKDNTCYCLKPSKKITYSSKDYFMKMGYAILTLAEFKEWYVLNEDKSQPKFAAGDEVYKTSGYCRLDKYTVKKAYMDDRGHWIYDLQGLIGIIGVEENNLCFTNQNPYTKLEAKDTMELNSETLTDDRKSSVKVEKELNLCELLRGHEGERFYSPAFEDVILINSRPEENRICIDSLSCFGREQLMENGTLVGPGECMLFPSRALYEQYPLDPYTAWMKWQEEQKKYALSVAYIGSGIDVESSIMFFRTSAERDKCIQEIKAIIEKYRK